MWSLRVSCTVFSVHVYYYGNAVVLKLFLFMCQLVHFALRVSLSTGDIDTCTVLSWPRNIKAWLLLGHLLSFCIAAVCEKCGSVVNITYFVSRNSCLKSYKPVFVDCGREKIFKGTVQPKLGSIDRSSLKREARRFLEKSAHPPSCESPLKLQRPLVQ